MKKLINTLSFILFIGVVGLSAQFGNDATAENLSAEKGAIAANQQTVKVKAYYFHANRRCATCEAVEAVSKEAIKDYYGNKVVFESINRDEEKDNPLLKKYKISGQTFLVVSGNKKVDLTNDAFLNARTKPEKFKRKLKSTIDSML